MEFSFKNSFLKINPYLRQGIQIIKEALGILILAFSLYFLFYAPFKNLKFLGLFFILFFLTQFLRKDSSKEDIRQSKDKINLNDYLTKTAQNFLIKTITKAEILKVSNFQIFLLKELLKNKKIRNLFFRLGTDFQNFNQELLKITQTYPDLTHLPAGKAGTNVDNFRESSFKEILIPILSSSFDLAKKLNYPHLNLIFVFYGLRINSSQELNEFFEKFDLKKEYLLSAILMEIYSEKIKLKRSPQIQPLSVFQAKFSKKTLLNPSLTSKATNILDSYSLDLTYLVSKESAGFLIGHQEELERLINYLRRTNNVLIVGEEGTGKETIIMHLAWLIQNGLAPKELLDFRVVKLDLGLVYAQNKEKFLPLLTKILEDVLSSGYIILYLPYFENILLEKEVEIMQALQEILISRSIPIIASMTPLGYEKSLTRYNLEQFFEKIEVKELSEEESIYLLTLKSLLWEKKEKVIISPIVIFLAVSLAKKFIRTEPLPKSAEEVILESISLAKKNKQKLINREIVQEIVAEKTKIPVGELGEIEKEKLLNLENLLHQRIIDQEEAIKEISRVLKIYRAGIEKKKGPIGSFLFVGPTGVGKTETAKALAKIYYGSEKQMIRLDMVEFQNPEDIDKLIGSKDGTILGRLTEPIRQNPFSLILLDEFEKTHPTILKIFLPIFDEGFIKDALGREIDFTNSLIICTSNAHSEFIKESLEKGENFDKIKEKLKSKLSQIFSIELLNRFDGIIVYKPLGQKELFQIAELLINDLKAELLLKQGIDLEVSQKALEEIVRLGTDPIFGARPLNRKINEIIRSEIANLILANKLSRGNKIFIDFDQEFKFSLS
jgi:ATP-dependent Clp protease ATP-binding subunit ClpC